VRTRALRDRYSPNDSAWTVEQGSALDRGYVDRLGSFDIVYSWGVLHHTGSTWEALDNAARPVTPGGLLFIALYADQGAKSVFWRRIKRIYVGLPRPLRVPWAVAVAAPFELRLFAKDLLAGHPQRYIETWTKYQEGRSMSRWYDLLDWMGGYPYEVASPKPIEEFYAARGFTMLKVHPTGGAGCIEYVLRRDR